MSLLFLGGDQGNRPDNQNTEKTFNAQLGGNVNLTCDIVGKYNYQRLILYSKQASTRLT